LFTNREHSAGEQREQRPDPVNGYCFAGCQYNEISRRSNVRPAEHWLGDV
jgi:hypothetical protein